MPDILHRVFIKSTPERVYQAVASEKGLSSWWTSQTRFQAEVGTTAAFRFGDGRVGPDMEIVALIPEEYAEWRCVRGVPEWVNTRITFSIRPHAQGVLLLFGHRDWDKPTEFFMHCNTKWGFFLGTSLKQYLETGQGQPHPQDPDL